MRTIKFRGKDIKTGEWLYGNIQVPSKQGVPYFMYDRDHNQKEVISKTVGQFTGLLDGERKDIFEGDIMRIPETEFNIEIIGVVEFDRGSYVVRSFFSGTHSSLAWAIRERQSGERRGIVIGNIYDNPELLKGGAE